MSNITKKNILLMIFVVLSIAYFISSYLYIFCNLQLPYDMNDHGIVVFLISVIILIAIVCYVKAVYHKKDMKRNQITLTVLILVLLCGIGNIYYTAHGFTTVGIMHVDKIEENRDYFLILDGSINGRSNIMKLECDETTYNNVIADKNVQYCVEFTWNLLTPHTGHLLSIDLDDYCDNRK